MNMTFTKAQARVLNQVKKLGSGCASTGMIAHDLNLKAKTVTGHLKALEAKGAVTGKPCNFHADTTVYEMTDEGNFWLEPAAL